MDGVPAPESALGPAKPLDVRVSLPRLSEQRMAHKTREKEGEKKRAGGWKRTACIAVFPDLTSNLGLLMTLRTLCDDCDHLCSVSLTA